MQIQQPHESDEEGAGCELEGGDGVREGHRFQNLCSIIISNHVQTQKVGLGSNKKRSAILEKKGGMVIDWGQTSLL
jgi:hypothetical protein